MAVPYWFRTGNFFPLILNIMIHNNEGFCLPKSAKM